MNLSVHATPCPQSVMNSCLYWLNSRRCVAGTNLANYIYCVLHGTALDYISLFCDWIRLTSNGLLRDQILLKSKWATVQALPSVLSQCLAKARQETNAMDYNHFVFTIPVLSDVVKRLEEWQARIDHVMMVRGTYCRRRITIVLAFPKRPIIIFFGERPNSWRKR